MHRSPHDVDPLSWFAGPIVPAVMGGFAMTFGVAASVATHKIDRVPAYDWAALLSLFLGFVVVWFGFNPRRKPPGFVVTSAPVLLGWASVVFSTFGHIDGHHISVENWWAPIGLAFLIGALAPYATATRLLIVGGASALVTGSTIVLVPFNRLGRWPPFSEGLIGSGPVLVATAATTVFAYQIAKRVEHWATTDPGSSLTSGVMGEAARLHILRSELARVSDRVVPLLQKVADTGEVTAQDREQAQLLSEEVRAELVHRANRSWLDTLTGRMNLTILDTEHRADQMTANQRTALLGLLHAANEGHGGARSAIVIQLRGEPDGSTAVAVSADVDFPEGRRVTLLAPHYFSLKATVDNLEWTAGSQLSMRFRLPAEPK